MSDIFDHVVYARSTIEFITISSEYCVFVESSDTLKRSVFIDKSQKLLSLLYLKACLAPAFEKSSDDFVEKFVDETQYNYVFQTVSDVLGLYEQYVDVNEPATYKNGESTQVSMAECFADIYQDLKDMLGNYQSGIVDAMNDALWECVQNFEQFWGPRILAMLPVIHNLMYSGENLDIAEEKKSEKKQLKKTDTSNWLINQYFNSNTTQNPFLNDE